MKQFFLLFSILFVCLIFITESAISKEAINCDEYELIFARGSGQKIDDVDFNTIKEAILKETDVGIAYYELGTAKDGYPANSVDFLEALGIYISARESYGYSESVNRGATELISRVKTESKRCKDKKFILVGYSQGAQVVGEALEYVNSDRIVYVATFGDPKLYLPEGKNKSACKDIGLSPYRVYVPDCEVYEGVLKGKNPYQPAGYENKIGVWCNQNDIFCGSSLNIFDVMKGHTTYQSNENGYKKFAKLLSKIVNKNYHDETVEARYSEAPPRDVAVLVDYHTYLPTYADPSRILVEGKFKEKLIELTKKGTRVAIYYIQTNSNPALNYELVIPFTNDGLEEKINKMNHDSSMRQVFSYNLTDNNNLYSAIKKISNEADWNPNHERNIYVMTNTYYDSQYSHDGSTEKDAAREAKKNNVKVSFISEFSGAQNKEKYEYIASESGGEMIWDDYSKIIPSAKDQNVLKKYHSKTFEINRNSEKTLVIISGCVYGISSEKKIVIGDLDASRPNEIIFIKYDNEGKIIDKDIYSYVPENIETPDTSGV